MPSQCLEDRKRHGLFNRSFATDESFRILESVEIVKPGGPFGTTNKTANLTQTSHSRHENLVKTVNYVLSKTSYVTGPVPAAVIVIFHVQHSMRLCYSLDVVVE
jgi:hypothetical protein